MTVQFWGRSPLSEVENHFGSTRVFSVNVCLQLGHFAISVIMKSTIPAFPVTRSKIQSNGNSLSSGWQCSQPSILPTSSP